MSQSPAIRILVAEDHFLARFAIVGFVGDQSDMQVVATAETGPQAVTLWRAHAPDVVVMDIALPELDGISAMEAIRRENADARILVLSNLDSQEDVHRALRAGARGFLRKDTPGQVLLDAIRRVHAGHSFFGNDVATTIAERSIKKELTPREMDVLRQLAAGATNREISQVLGLQEGTVRIYVSNILVKLGVKRRTEAVLEALRRGLVKRS